VKLSNTTELQNITEIRFLAVAPIEHLASGTGEGLLFLLYSFARHSVHDRGWEESRTINSKKGQRDKAHFSCFLINVLAGPISSRMIPCTPLCTQCRKGVPSDPCQKARSMSEEEMQVSKRSISNRISYLQSPYSSLLHYLHNFVKMTP
jgi:hypothetical protein